MQKLKLAVVGPGLIGLKHINLIGSSNNTELVAIVAPDQGDNRNIANQHGVPMHVTIDQCLSNIKVDGLIISSPNEFHFEQASFCIQRGIPVLVEKPVTVHTDEAKELVRIAEVHSSKLLVGHHRAYSPLLKTAQEIIKSDKLGKLVSIIGSAQFFKPAKYFMDGPWRTQPGGGPILINMIHEVGNLRSLMGEIASVQAIASSSIRKFAVEDTVAINFLFRSGALGTFLLSDTAATPRSWEQTSGENPAYPMYFDEDCYNIAGTRGSLSFPTMRLKYYPAGTEPSWWSPFNEETIAVARIDPLKAQFDHFLNVIRGTEKPLVSAMDGYRNLLVIRAIELAIQNSSVIDIED